MKTVKIMSIISLVFCGIVLAMSFAHMYATTYEWADGAIGWAMLMSLFVIAQSIVGIVVSKKIK